MELPHKGTLEGAELSRQRSPPVVGHCRLSSAPSECPQSSPCVATPFSLA